VLSFGCYNAFNGNISVLFGIYVKVSGFNGLRKQLNSMNLKRHITCILYTTHTSPILRYVSEHWPFSKKGGNMLLTFERRILRVIYSLINDSGIWRTRYNNEL
jgi:hypothetical protein